MTITINADAPNLIPVDLVGVHYLVKAPKAVVAIKIGMRAKELQDEDPEELLKLLGEWVSMAFSKKDAAAVMKRLGDQDDDLDLNHIVQLVEAVIEVGSGNPTS